MLAPCARTFGYQFRRSYDMDLDDIGPFLIISVFRRGMPLNGLHTQLVRHCSALIFCAGVMVLSQPTSAQRALDVERFTPALDDGGFLSIQGTGTPGSARWNTGLFFSYSHRPLEVTFHNPERSVSVVEHRLASHVIGQVGLGGRAALALAVPFVLAQTGDELVSSDTTLPVAALGDPRVCARYHLVGASADRQLDRRDGPGLAAQVGVALPVGHRKAFFAERSPRTDLRLLGDFQLLGAGIGASLGWLHRFEPKDAYDLRFRDAVSFGAAFKFPIPWFPNVVGALEVNGATDAGAPFSKSASTPVELDLGARIRLGDFTFCAALGAGVSRGVGAPAVRGTLGAWWAPHVRDADHDGVPDAKDQCQMLSEDFDGSEDTDGCPDLDNDGDGIPDLDDVCPDQFSEEGRDKNEDGCPD